VDSSAAALVVASRNAVKHSLEVELLHGPWYEPLAARRFDLIVSNPPYVAAGDPHLAELKFEPASALVSGREGLDALARIARGAPAHLERGGWLLLEHGMGQDEAVRRLLLEAGLEEVATWPDLAGIPRVSGGRR
jgi:release factor glutamine methyltransferase